MHKKLPEYYPITDNALQWLTQILFERFGSRWNLRRSNLGLHLALEGSKGQIVFDSIGLALTRTGSDQPFVLWEAEREGWRSVFGPLPAPGAEWLPNPLIEVQGTVSYIHYDILGLTYWMLSRLEEVGREDVDKHGRFPASKSHAYKHGYLERPIVDEWMRILGQVIECTWPGIVLKQHKFSMKVSHDVDIVSSYAFHDWPRLVRAIVSNVLLRRDLVVVANAVSIRLNTRLKLQATDPANTFDWIMDISEEYELKSAFYFICGRTAPKKDASYNLDNPLIRNLMRHIHLRGHEIGLHPSYGSFQRPDFIAEEAKHLIDIAKAEGIGQNEWGGRMHYLRWKHPTTLRALDQAGMAYDSTLSYADRAGFRCGTCFEYPAFDPVASESLALRIRPLIAMEVTVMDYMGLGRSQAALDKFLQLKDACRSVGGCFTLLWHNTSLTTSIDRELYKNILAS
jgi:hypothetical protein